MRAVVKKWGNSSSVRIPSAVPSKEYDLSELLKRITPENLHEETDFGRPVGKEAW